MSTGPLSVLHFSTADVLGGSARSAYRLHTGLRTRGHRSRMLVGYRQSQDPDVQLSSGRKPLQYVDRIANKITGFFGYQYLFVPSSLRLAYHPWIREANIIQLFNTHGRYFAQGMLPRLAARAPLVWRLSDMWPFTGHCAYSGDCTGWLSGCPRCPKLDSDPPIGRDRAAALYRMKERLYAKTPMTIVVPSSWMEQQVRKSSLLSRFPMVRIPNGLKADEYRPSPRHVARQKLGLPSSALIILFSAHILDANPRKGGDILLQALKILGPKPEWLLLLLGQGGDSWQGQTPIPLFRMGYQSDPAVMAQCYAAADVVVIPSVLENLPNTLIESLACGRVVVASDCGGMRDGVRHGVTGLLTKMGDAHLLACSIQQLLEAADRRAAMEHEARLLFEREFTAERELDRYESLYSDLYHKHLSAKRQSSQ